MDLYFVNINLCNITIILGTFKRHHLQLNHRLSTHRCSRKKNETNHSDRWKIHEICKMHRWNSWLGFPAIVMFSFPGFSITEMCPKTDIQPSCEPEVRDAPPFKTHLFWWGQIKVKDLVQKAGGLKKETERFHMVFSVLFFCFCWIGDFWMICSEWSIAISIYIYILYM